MNEMLKMLLSLSFSGTVVFLMIMVSKQFYRNRFCRRWQYYIWLIAALRFLLPFTPDISVAGRVFGELDAFISRENKAEPQNSAVEPGGLWEGADMGGEASGEASLRKDIDSGAVDGADRSVEGAVFAWWGIALILFVRKIAAYVKFVRYIRADSREVTDIKILNLLSGCKERLKVQKRVKLSQSELIASPVMTGFFRPNIILPAAVPKERGMIYIFIHELIHYKRGDLFYKWLIQAVLCIHWFNPFVYLMAKEVERDCELSCDEEVLSLLGAEAGREYGDVLLWFLRSRQHYKNSPASLTLTEGAKQIKERLGAIMNFKKQSGITLAASLLTAVFFASAGFVIGAYAAPVQNQEETAAEIGYFPQKGHLVTLEDNVFYIYRDGAQESDRPVSSTTEGSVAFVLVWQSGYAATSGYSDLETLVSDVAGECDEMMEKGWITEEDKNLIIETAMTVTRIPGRTGMGDSATDYAVLTYRVAKEDAPDVIRSWMETCDRFGENIFKTEYEGRYWIYTNAVGKSGSGFRMTSDAPGSARIEIVPDGSDDIGGYALLSVPTGYKSLTAVCGEYVTVIDGIVN